MNKATLELLLFFITDVCSCMALSLAIGYKLIHPKKWVNWCLIFHSCLIMCIIGDLVLRLVPSLEYLKPVIDIIQQAIFGFVLVAVPYTTFFILNKNWGKGARIVFYPLGTAYGLVGILHWYLKTDFFVTAAIQTFAFQFSFICCAIFLMRNISLIPEKKTQSFVYSLIIISLILIPLSVLGLVIKDLFDIIYAFYTLAFSVILLCFFFISFKSERRHYSTTDAKFNDDLLEATKISKREYEVIEWVCEGLKNKDIAKEMGISVNTVNNHVASIFEKLKVNSRVELIRKVKGSIWN